MNYFSHHIRPTGKIWSLFAELSEASSQSLIKNVPMAFSHTVEIINTALSGNSVMLSDENFSLTAYEYGCRKNDKVEKYLSAKKELFIVDVDEHTDAEDNKVGFGDISSKRLGHKDVNFDMVLDNQAFDECLARLLGIREYTTISYGVDIVVALKSSLEGIEGATNEVKKVVEKDKVVEDVIISLCQTAKGGLLERLQAVA